MKKNVAFFGVKYFPSRGGVSRITENLIRELKDEFDITIYCYKNEKAINYIEGVNVIQFREIPLKGVGVFIYYLLCFLHIMFIGNYDIIHVQKIDSAFFLPFFSLKYKNILATSHESPYVRDKWGKFAKLYFKFNEKIFINSKAKLTVISKPLSKYYKKRYEKNVLFIPNGVEVPNLVHDEKVKQILNKYQIKDPFIMFGARRIMATKGCHTLLKALKIIDYKGDIVIAGDTTQLPSYTKHLMELSKNLNTHFLGYIGNKSILLGLIKQAFLFVFPSETEGMSIMLLEVASLGIPIIASDIDENTAVFNENELLFFKNKDEHDLANKLLWALNNIDKMKILGQNAKKRVENEYSNEVITHYYRSLYNSF